MARRALARKITRKQALSYKRTTPNPLGVTAIAAVNGSASYARRYAATRRLLDEAEGGTAPSRKGKSMRRRRATANRATPKKRKVARKSSPAQRAARARFAAKYGKKSRFGGPAKFAHAKMASPWKFPKRKKARRKASSVPKGRVYGGKYRALRARIGGRSRPTYTYLTKKKKVRKIPDFALMGYRSKKAQFKRELTQKGANASLKRQARLKASRERNAERISKRVLAGKYAFTPNKRRRARRAKKRVVSFHQWEKSMIANARRAKKRKKVSRRRRKVGVRVSARTVKYKHRVKANKRKRRVKRRHRATPAQLRSLKKARAARRRKSKKGRKRHTAYAANRKRRVKRRKSRKARRNPLMQAAANRRRHRRVRRNRRHVGRRRHARRNPLMQAAANRRRRRGVRRNRKHSRRGYKRNVSLFVSDFIKTMKTAGIVSIGLVVQKGLSKYLSTAAWADPVLGKLPPAFKNTIVGLLTAAAGMTLVQKVAPGEAKHIGLGMGAGLVHTILMDVLTAIGQPAAVNYLGDYTESQGKSYSGYGSYYEFQPGQVYNGVGEYFTQPGVSGFGNVPQLTQAAAGVGEYFVTGVKGIGEYEEVTPEYSAPTSTRDGIRPDLNSAEHAMSVAEAAAGVGMYGGGGGYGTYEQNQDVALQSTVYPTGGGENIPDQPGGSRAGVFCGDNGVFGPCG